MGLPFDCTTLVLLSHPPCLVSKHAKPNSNINSNALNTTNVGPSTQPRTLQNAENDQVHSSFPVSTVFFPARRRRTGLCCACGRQARRQKHHTYSETTVYLVIFSIWQRPRLPRRGPPFCRLFGDSSLKSNSWSSTRACHSDEENASQGNCEVSVERSVTEGPIKAKIEGKDAEQRAERRSRGPERRKSLHF